jgi:hypothetical protein
MRYDGVDDHLTMDLSFDIIFMIVLFTSHTIHCMYYSSTSFLIHG